MSIITKLNRKTYLYKQNEFPSMNLPGGIQYGIMAQELAEVLPGLTKKGIQPAVKDSLGKIVHKPVEFTAVNYTELIPILLAGIKEQQSTIDELQKRVVAQDAAIATMQEQVNKMAATMASNNKANDRKGYTVTEVALGDGQAIILDDNVPNPFQEQTAISYFLPDNVNSAQMLFYNLEGKLIRTVQLESKGKGMLNVFAKDLSNGVYTYTLVADGKIIQTKRMVKQQ